MGVTHASHFTEPVCEGSMILEVNSLTLLQKQTRKPTGTGATAHLATSHDSLATATTTVAQSLLNQRATSTIQVREAITSMVRPTAMVTALAHRGNGCLECNQSRSTKMATIKTFIPYLTRIDLTKL